MMLINKKILIVCLLFLGTTLSYAQSGQEKKNTIKSNVFAIIAGGTDALSYERVLSNKTSISIGVGYSDSDESDLRYLTYGAGLEFKYYLKEALRGWFANAGISYSTGDISSSTLTDDIPFNNLAYGAKIGYQWLWNNGITVGIDVGYILKDYNYNNSTDTNGLRSSEGIPNLGLSVGYSF